MSKLRLTVLALALVSLCLTASAAVASAAVYRSEISSPDLFASGSSSFVFNKTSEPLVLKCSRFELEGQATGSGKQLTNPSLYPSFTGCSSGELGGKVENQGCWLNFGSPSLSGLTDMDLACGEGQIKIIWIGCTWTFGTQHSSEAVALSNIGSGRSRAVEAKIKMKLTGHQTSGCPGGVGTVANDYLEASLPIKGYTSVGHTNQTGFWIE